MTRDAMELYRALRSAGIRASDAKQDAEVMAQFAEREAVGLVRFRVEQDRDPDVSWMTERERAEWDGESWGVIGEVRCPCCNQWKQVDSVWGLIGYKNLLSPLENPYIPSIASATLTESDHSLNCDSVSTIPL